MKALIYAVGLFMFFASCTNGAKEQKMLVRDLALYAPPAMNNRVRLSTAIPPPGSSSDISRKIIKEGEINFETKNISETRNSIYASLQKLGGYIAEEKETNDTANSRNEYVLTARIPENNFDVFLNSVSENAAKIDSKSIRARDVTTEYIDIATHLANKKKLEDRYVDLLKKGTKIADLLEIENKISQIETSVDSTQGQLNYLVKQIEYSSLDVTFYTKKANVDNSQGFGSKFINALAVGWGDLIAIFLGFISIWPLWIILIISYFPVKNWLKNHPGKKEEKS